MTGKPKKRKGQQPQEIRRLRPIRRKLIAMAAEEGREIVIQPAGEERMSEIVLQFVEPFMRYAETLTGFERLIGLAALAWNAALMTKEEGQAAVEEAVRSSVKEGDRQTAEDMRIVLRDLIRRKKRHFKRYRRQIVSYAVSEEKEGFYLSVAFLISGQGEGDNLVK